MSRKYITEIEELKVSAGVKFALQEFCAFWKRVDEQISAFNKKLEEQDTLTKTDRTTDHVVMKANCGNQNFIAPFDRQILGATFARGVTHANSNHSMRCAA